MTSSVLLEHITRYKYDPASSLSPQVIRLRPAPHTRTPIKSYSLTIEPAEHFINWQQDPFGNHLARVVFPEKVESFEVKVNLVAELVAVNPFDFFLEPEAEKFPFEYPELSVKELGPYLECKDDWTGELASWLESVRQNDVSTVDFLLGLSNKVSQVVDYEIRYEEGVQTSNETLSKGSGSCRDSAWFLVETLRHLGLAARFVSGYLVQLVPDQKPTEGPVGPDEDFTDLHAWCEVYLPGAGWIGLDPTSGLAAGEGHIPLVATPDPQSAAPITGSSSDPAIDFFYSNVVTRIEDEPRSTQPFTDSQWKEITRLGIEIDERLAESDVRLTVGGEPTFVSATDLDSPEWNTDADGPDKRKKANQLAMRLRSKFAPGGILQYGQGKWYPGEVLPRWQISMLWRKDNVALWNDPSLLANPEINLGHDDTTVRRFTEHLADELGASDEIVQTAYEDPFYGIWKESSLPPDLEEMAAEADSKDSRAEFLATIDESQTTPAGYFIPIDRHGNGNSWLSSSWPLKRSKVFLIPGDSPMGMRLPLDSLPDESNTHLEETPELDPLAMVDSLGASDQVRSMIRTEPIIIRKAVCVEVRNGVTHVFLPPFTRANHSVELLRSIERAAITSNVPVVLEGYPITQDKRLERLSVTPDPGVIEVNVHPAKDSAELQHINSVLYEEARLCGLATEKFHLDGRHTGTGGGNHITLGGQTPSDSPFLRRPDVLCSLIRYWQNHPSLSYVFSGLFVGPTSQAPRVDEARLENLHELEIALQEIENTQNPSPWLADRALRHLLTDLTGNTHRAELCIDKMFSPDSATGRLGLLELRAFEMPPHFQMSMLCYSLVRATVARFWDEPYRNPLVRWGTDLHDRFLLPHYLGEDLSNVCKDLSAHGFRFNPSWFEPFFAFRFPRYGTIIAGDVSVELRSAIEPWLVLGEENDGNGMARYVDSSMERLQVKTYGLHEERYKIIVNGHAIPLRATGRPGEFVSGVKYRAWHPPSALHPTIGVHTPLTFEVVDEWGNNVVGGAKYHVSHPGGRNYESIPVNAREAEARRQSRFDSATLVQQGSLSQESLIEKQRSVSVGVMSSHVESGPPRVEPILADYAPTVVPESELDFDFPTTLDLRSKPHSKT